MPGRSHTAIMPSWMSGSGRPSTMSYHQSGSPRGHSKAMKLCGSAAETWTRAAKPKSPDFERPQGFDVRAFVNRSPWTFTTEPVEEVVLRLEPEAADTFNEDFGPAAEKTQHGTAHYVRFRCGNPEFAVSRVLAAKGAIVVEKGDRLKARLTAELDAIAARYA